MVDWTPVPLVAEACVAASWPASAKRLVNLYAGPVPEGSKAPFVLLPRPGLLPWAEVGDGPCRGQIVMGDYLWVVSGEEIYRVARDGSSALIGVIEGTRDCYMTENGTHVGIAADAHIYAANADGVIEVSTQRAVGAAGQDGYGAFVVQGSQRFYIAGPDDLTTIDLLDFSTADVYSDQLVGCISSYRELFLAKERSAEFWVNTGNAAFPFERAGFIERGCVAGGSIAKAERRVIWLGDDRRVHATSGGYQSAPVSTPAIDLLIQQVNDPSSARAFTYTQDGHVFYAINFATLSLALDLTTGKWQTRETWGEDRWRAHHCAFFGGRNIVGDFETGDLYRLDATTYSDDGVANRYLFTSAEIHADGRPFIMGELYLEVETGVGNVVEPDDDPEISLRWSDDGGRSWSQPRTAKLGRIGDYGRQVTFTRLGMAKRNRILEFSTRAEVRVAATGVKARIEVLS